MMSESSKSHSKFLSLIFILKNTLPLLLYTEYFRSSKWTKNWKFQVTLHNAKIQPFFTPCPDTDFNDLYCSWSFALKMFEPGNLWWFKSQKKKWNNSYWDFSVCNINSLNFSTLTVFHPITILNTWVLVTGELIYIAPNINIW